MTDPKAELLFTTTPYVLNVTGSNKWIYSGRLIMRPIQWGALSLNVDTGSFRMVCPVVGPGPGFPPAALTKCSNGDFHQSASFMAASAGVEKWALTTINSLGSHFGCSPVTNPSKVQFYQATSVGLQYYGEVFIDCFGADSAIIGDRAYIDMGNGTWTVVDLPTLQAIGPPVTQLPPHIPQLGIEG